MIRALNYIVTGAGHTGTGYMAQLLRSAGIRCGHENVFRVDRVMEQGGEMFDADSSWAAAPFLDHPICTNAKILHVIRNPLNTLRSLVHGGTDGAADAWAGRLVGVNEDTAWEWQGRYYLEWNKLIEKNAVGTDYHLFKVEDRTKILDKLGLEQRVDWDIPTYNAHISNRRVPFTWDMVPDSLVKEELIEFARENNYEA